MVLGSSYTIRRQLVGIEALDKDEKSGDPFLPLWSCMVTVEEMGEVKLLPQTTPQTAEKGPTDF